MATKTNLLKISKALASKIWDPISTGGADGRLFSSELRLGYINRAFGSLLRTLEVLHPKLLKVFKDYYQIIPITLTNASYELTKNYDVFDVYYSVEDVEDVTTLPQYRATWIEPVNYLSTKNGLNDFRESSDNQRYWTIINNNVVLLPTTATYTNVNLLVRNDFPEFMFPKDDNSDTGTDVNIPNDYVDILITMAAIEAMNDRGDQAKYQLYTAALNSKLEILGLKKKADSIKEEGIS